MTNIKYKVCGPMNTHFIRNLILKLDISESVSYLRKHRYLVENYHISQWSTKGFVFAYSNQLKKLEWHGWLTLIDSIHKTNQYNWCLFTLYICDTYRCWNVGTHFFVSNEDADTVAEALIIIYNKYYNWSLHYILSDQSSIEAKSIKKAFPNITANE